MENRPNGREKNITGKGKSIYKRGEGQGTGPVGSSDGYAGKPAPGGSTGNSGSGRATTRAGGRSPLLVIILAAVLLLGGGGAGLGGLLGGGNQSHPQTPQQQIVTYTQQQYQQQNTQGVDLASLLGGFTGGGSVSTGWQATSNVGKLNTEVAKGARSKYTTIKGGGKDTVTIMVYMCGTDLESRSKMGTSDLQEMLNATIGSNVNLLVYTGGCKQWQNSVVSSTANEVYKVENGGLRRLAQVNSVPMTDPDTLSDYIQFCAKNYPANRNMLIFWDHGGGSLSGYGYDEKFKSSGSMTLQGIDKALKNGGVKFDMIGFDACLMATLENALTLAPYGDYLVASEETEPGVGWYYTNWLTNLSKNTSLSTLEIGKNIADDFVSVCAQQCRGQATTLSVVDLAELEKTAPDKLSDFAQGTTKLLKDNQYQTVSKARGNAREFAASNKIDQVDLIHLASNLGTAESKALAQTLMNAVKYNRTSSDMTNAYGLSIYFPYKAASKVKSAVAAYDAIGMDSDYARCIQQFASMEQCGQQASTSTGNPLGALMGNGNSAAAVDPQMLMGILSTLMQGRSLPEDTDLEETARFFSDNTFDASALVWTEQDGMAQLRLSQQQWSLVDTLELNVFFDDGEGYIDLGLDNVFSFTADGALVGDFDGTWLAINDQPVAYYHTSTVYDGDSYTITGRVPAMVNGVRADLIIVFDNEHPYGYIAGYRTDYRDGETDTVAKAVTELVEGDELEFLCDYYGYDGSYQDSYFLGDPMTVEGEMTISNVYVDEEACVASYRFTDIYCNTYWTTTMP